MQYGGTEYCVTGTCDSFQAGGVRVGHTKDNLVTQKPDWLRQGGYEQVGGFDWSPVTILLEVVCVEDRWLAVSHREFCNHQVNQDLTKAAGSSLTSIHYVDPECLYIHRLHVLSGTMELASPYLISQELSAFIAELWSNGDPRG